MRWTVIAMLVVACDGGTVPVGDEDPDAALCAVVEADAGPLETATRGNGPYWQRYPDKDLGIPASWSDCDPHTADGAGHVDIVADWEINCWAEGDSSSSMGTRSERWRCPVQQFDQGWALTDECEFIELIGMICGGRPYGG